MKIPIAEMEQDLKSTKRERDWYAEGARIFREIAASAARPNEHKAALIQSRECAVEMRRRDRFISRLETLIQYERGKEEANRDDGYD